MVDGIPNHKTIKKLARRHLEDFEPKRWKKSQLRLLWFLVPVIFLVFGVVLMLNVAQDINHHEGDGIDYVEEYGVDGARIVALGGAGILFIGLVGALLVAEELSKDEINLVDYYFENVHQDQDEKGVE